MLNTKKVGKKIATLRKSAGYSQEKLSELLGISPQAISKWENGHCLPETAILPCLADIFDCSIDDILMCGYSSLRKKSNLDLQIKKITENIVRELNENLMTEQMPSVTDDEIIAALYKSDGNIGPCTVKRKPSYTIEDVSVSEITVKARQLNFELIEKKYSKDCTELIVYDILSKLTPIIPHVYFLDINRKVLITDKLSKDYVSGISYDCDSPSGEFFRTQYMPIIKALAEFHAQFWQNTEVFNRMLPTDCPISPKQAEAELERYIQNEKQNRIPKVYRSVINEIAEHQFDVCKKAIEYIKTKSSSKNVTVIHGNLNPGMINVSTKDGSILLDNFRYIRKGIATDDLAMLIGLHAFVTKERSVQYLDYYYKIFSEKIPDYSYDTFINDYKYSLAKAVLYTITLMNSGVYDFTMRDKAILAFENFITED